ncbi:unnamed protein product [Brassica rapa subsp. trilocularis]
MTLVHNIYIHQKTVHNVNTRPQFVYPHNTRPQFICPHNTRPQRRIHKKMTFLQNNRKKSKSERPNLKIIENPPLLLDLLCDETETAMMSTTRLESEHDTVGRARRRRWSGGLRQTRRAAAEKRELKTVAGDCNGREAAKLGCHELQSKVRRSTKKMNQVKLATETEDISVWKKILIIQLFS